MKLSIRETDDIGAVQALDAVCFPLDAREDFSDQWTWLCTLGDEEVGFSAFKIEDGVPSITRMGITPAARGARLQRKMATVLSNAARRMGFKLIKTYVRADNLASLSNLMAAGFRPTKTWVDDSQYKSWFINLEKKLTPSE